MADLKISQFPDGGTIQVADQVATNRSGTNTRVVVGSGATLDAGTDIGDLVVLGDVGGGTPGLPAVDGSQLIIDAVDISFEPDSNCFYTLAATNVFEAIRALDIAIQDFASSS